MAENKNLGEDLKESIDNAKDQVKQTAQDVGNEIGAVSKEGKNIAIIAHITLIGWIVALVMNNNAKSDFGSFYIRQFLGLFLAGIILSFIPLIGLILNLVIIVFWIMSFIGALNGQKKLTPLLGEHFQNWFKSL